MPHDRKPCGRNLKTGEIRVLDTGFSSLIQTRAEFGNMCAACYEKYVNRKQTPNVIIKKVKPEDIPLPVCPPWIDPNDPDYDC